jgi:hypothetical protein
LEVSIGQDFAARYCPHSKAIFMMRFGTLFAVFVIVALVLLIAARRRATRGFAPSTLYVFGCGLLVFAIGSAVLILYGISGCSGVAAEGLIWDWP